MRQKTIIEIRSAFSTHHTYKLTNINPYMNDYFSYFWLSAAAFRLTRGKRHHLIALKNKNLDIKKAPSNRG
jgi:hypothetical protein